MPIIKSDKKEPGNYRPISLPSNLNQYYKLDIVNKIQTNIENNLFCVVFSKHFLATLYMNFVNLNWYIFKLPRSARVSMHKADELAVNNTFIFHFNTTGFTNLIPKALPSLGGKTLAIAGHVAPRTLIA